jgi:hypothetical protein
MSLDDNIQEEYDERFSKGDKMLLKEIYGISPKQANQYDPIFNIREITRLVKANISPKQANQYNKRFTREDTTVDITVLVKAGVSPDKANQYNPRFNIAEITRLAEADISPDRANSYPSRFNAGDIIELAEADISPKQANKYSKRFNSLDITRLVEANISPKQANQYNKQLDGWSITKLVEYHISIKKADQYNERFDGLEIVRLIKENTSPDKANSYPSRFNARDIIELIDEGIYPNQINSYSKRFAALDIVRLKKAKIPPKKANSYPSRFNVEEIIELIEADTTSDQANKYNQRFSGWAISSLAEANVSPTKADKYNERFRGGEIVELLNANISPQKANQYPEKFKGNQISILFKIGFTPKSVLSIPNGFYNLLERIACSGEVRTHPDEFHILGMGSSAAVLLKEDSAWKFSQLINQEYELLKRIQDKHNGNQKNIVKLIGEPKEDLALEIQYIQGQTLQSILEQHSLSPEKALKYGAGIMNGLIEMRRAKIWYHRDIRPANIMIDKERDEPVIVDFGIASQDRHALPQNNKRFGGPNDLTSLGQVMYYMATGMHIFDQSQSMSRTFGSVADEINDYRTKVYSDPTGKLLEQHLGQVDSEIKDERVATLIKSCLTARRGQYKRMQRMFRRYEE